jgi:8-oxo-dGTP diphosphatase
MSYLLIKIFMKLGLIPKLVKTTVGLIAIRHGKILLEKRNIFIEKGKWCLPGGHIEFGEGSVDALKREVKEELNLSVKNLKFLGYFDEIIPRLKDHSVVLVYGADVSGEIKMQKSEVADFGWFGLKEMGKLDMAFRHREIIKKFWRGK